jgi:hypothetical protein
MKIPAIPYVSPSLRFDQEARVVVVEYRNADTGKVARQIPSEEAVRRAATEAESAGPPSVSKDGEGAGAGTASPHQPEAEAAAAPPTDESAAAASPRISIEV